MAHGRGGWAFLARSFIVWLIMVAILVVVPDYLDRWMSLEISRVIGWALACGVWVVAVEQEWKDRFGGPSRFFLQLVLWVGAALVALWVSDVFRVR
jgi:hypothetical protein